MTDIPEPVTLEWIGRQLLQAEEEIRYYIKLC